MFKVGTFWQNDADPQTNEPYAEALGIAYPAKGTFWSTNGIPPIWPDELTPESVNAAGMGNEPYLNWLQYVLAQSKLPYVISTSYDDDEQTVPFVSSACIMASFDHDNFR